MKEGACGSNTCRGGWREEGRAVERQQGAGIARSLREHAHRVKKCRRRFRVGGRGRGREGGGRRGE